jgi:adenylate cyclase
MAGEKILVIDDGKENREFVIDYVLKPAGYDTIQARDGVEGLQLARNEHPDLILLDLQMPKMNGIQVLEAMRAEAMTIPVILMTFYGTEEVAVDVFRLGVRDYVKKPYTIDEMLSAIDSCLSDTRIQREKEALTSRLLSANRELHGRLRDSLTGGVSIPSIGQSREATILTAGLRGITSIQAADAGEYLGIINQYIMLAIETITRRGGTVFQASGEGISAVFNAPDDLAQYCLRAVEAARELQSATLELHQKGFPMLTFGVGIDTGVVVAGGIGVTPVVAFTVLGDPVTLARRIQESSQPGQVLVSGNVYQVINSAVVLSKAAEYTIRGRTDPLVVYALKR